MTEVKHPSTNTQIGRVIAVGLKYPLPATLEVYAQRIQNHFGVKDSESAIGARLRDLRKAKYPDYGMQTVHVSGSTYRYRVLHGRDKDICERAGLLEVKEGAVLGKPCRSGAPSVPTKWAAEQIIAWKKGAKSPEQVQEELAAMPETTRVACRTCLDGHKAQIKQLGYQRWSQNHLEVEAECSQA